MDPMDRGPEDPNTRNRAAGSGDAAARSHAVEGAGFDADAALPVPAGRSGGAPAASATSATSTTSAAPGDKGARRPVQVIAGELLVTVNPIDGSEVELCPPDRRPPFPVRRSAEERAERARAARPPLPPGLVPHRPPLPEHQEVRRRLVRLLSRGRSIRLTGPSGSGRTTLLDGVAEDCAHLAPDGVIRLSGHRRTVKDLLYDLFSDVYAAEFSAVYATGRYRPDDALLRRLVGEIGAVVLLDDLEFGGQALDELLDATPECAFVFAATPDTPAPSSDVPLEEIHLSGVGRNDGMDLLRQTVGRELTEEERDWAADLWFASEGLPARFVQAGALLRYRDQAHARAAQQTRDPLSGPGPVPQVPLPSLAEGSAPVALLASLLSPTARALLQFAVALGGEVPHRAQLPALLSDPHADGALGELLTAGLLTPVGARYRLAAGVQQQLESAGYGEGAAERADAAGEHYIWWTGHRSVSPERVLAESDTVLATLAALVPAATVPSGPAGTDGERSRAVQLARTAAPAFVAELDWGVWERALRSGQEAARRAGEVAEEAYFHHELGVLALCTGRLDRARAELEASIGLRGVLADKRGTVTGRRALALVEDRAAARASGAGPAPAGEPHQDGPSGSGAPGGSGDTPESAVQTSFGAGVPFLAPEDPPTTELRQISDPSQGPAAQPDAAAGTGATPPGIPGHRHPADGYPESDDDPYPRPDGLSYSRFGEGPYPGTDEEPEPGGDSHGDPDGPATLVARAPGRAAADEVPAARSEGRHGTTKNTKRNLVAAAGGTLLAAILGTVVTLGTTSDHGKPSSTVDPDPSVSQQDGDGAADEQASHPDGPSTASPSSSSGSPSASDSTSPSASRSTGAPAGAGHASSPSGTPSGDATTKPPTHRPPTTKPPTTKPPTSKPPTSSPPPASPSESTTADPGSPESSLATPDRLSTGASSVQARF